MWFATIRRTLSRSALGSFSRWAMVTAISAPMNSCLKKLYSPGASSLGSRARGLPTSCSSAPSRSTTSGADTAASVASVCPQTSNL